MLFAVAVTATGTLAVTQTTAPTTMVARVPVAPVRVPPPPAPAIPIVPRTLASGAPACGNVMPKAMAIAPTSDRPCTRTDKLTFRAFRTP